MASWDLNAVAPKPKVDPWTDVATVGSPFLLGAPLLGQNQYIAPIGFNIGTGTGAPLAKNIANFFSPLYPYTSSYPNAYPAIQLNNTDMGGTQKLTSSPFMFPFGGFARLGDVLQVPFIGSYTLLNADGSILEINPVMRDCAMADDGDSSSFTTTGPDDLYEQIGRFCPIRSPANADKLAAPIVGLVMPNGEQSPRMPGLPISSTTSPSFRIPTMTTPPKPTPLGTRALSLQPPSSIPPKAPLMGGLRT